MKWFTVSSACLIALTVSACANSPQPTRIVRVDCSAGLELGALKPGELPRLIAEEGEDWRAYGEEMYALAYDLHGKLTVAHGALVDCGVG